MSSGVILEEDEPNALEPLPALHVRALRATAVGALWAAGALPSALGWQRCTVATLLHRPCPGCGMTRALRLLCAGDFSASLRMHALAAPVLVIGVPFAGATVWTTFRRGTPMRVHRDTLGRATIAAGVVVYAAALVLWALRWFGLFGGPVPV